MTSTMVKRPARIEPPRDESEPVAIESPPARGQSGQPAAGASMLMMPIMGGAGSVTVAISQKDKPIVAVAAFLALVGAIAIGLVMVVSQRSGRKNQEREGRERYLDYIETLRHQARERIASQRAEQAWRHPGTSALLDICRDDRRRWERRVGDADFLCLRIGTGDVPLRAGLTLDADTGPLNDFDPVALFAAQELQQRYATLRDQPVALELGGVGQLSLLGAPDVRRRVATNLLLQAVSLHGPDDLMVGVVRADGAAAAWEWLKWLPHALDCNTADGELSARRIAADTSAMQGLLAAELDTRLDLHQRSRGSDAGPQSHLVVVVDHDGLPAGQALSSPDPQVSLEALGVHVIVLADAQHEEPDGGTQARVELASDGTAVMSGRSAELMVDVPDPGLETVIARVLSAIGLVATDGAAAGPTETVGWAEILGVSDPTRLDLARTWRPRVGKELLRVPIGISAAGRSVLLDFKESAHGGMGPHGLVVGATGSGKSEMLRTLVSSLVIGHGPDRLALMLVDFKGGATFAALEQIPHVAGMITNLQNDLTLVDRMHDALFGEMQRRQEVLRAAGNLPNVMAYHDRIDAGEELEPLPHLLVIVDEFSELLTAKPDFSELFLAIGRIGRSIGVHLLLASQKLDTGKIRGLESHLSYRIGLRTFSEAESREVIGVPDAYHLPPEPGSGYLKVDTTVFERFKAALVSSPYRPPQEEVDAAVPVVPYVARNGLGEQLLRRANIGAQLAAGAPAGKSVTSRDRTVLDVLCAQITAAGASPARPVWLDPLPSVLPLDRVQPPDNAGDLATVKAVLGLVDEPAKQSQYPLEWDFAGSGGNLVIAGAPQAGKSTLLRTMMCSLALRYAPGNVAFYCVDYGGGSLQPLRALPHVAAVTTRHDPERIHRMTQEIYGILDAREELFGEYAIENMADYRRARVAGRVSTELPGDVFFVVDGWGSFREEHDDLDYAIDEIAARGGAYGVHVILTVTQGMQIRMRMQPSFGGRLELRLNDVYDAEFGRKLMEQIPKDAAGRGAMEGGRLFHAAVPRIDGIAAVGDLAEAQRATIQLIAERWPGMSVAPVETLPAVVRYDELPPVDPGRAGVPVGVLDRDLRASSIDLMGTNPHLRIFGDPDTGKTNLLKVLLRGNVALLPPERLGIVVVDYRRSLLDVVPEEYLVAYCTDREQTGRVARELAGALHDRLPAADVTSRQLRERSWWRGLEMLVVADDFDLVDTSEGNPLDPLIEYLPQGADLGFRMVVSRRVNGLARAQFEPFLQRLNDVSAPGFLFSGDRLEGRLIASTAARRLPAGRALYLNRNGLVGQVQTALFPDGS